MHIHWFEIVCMQQASTQYICSSLPFKNRDNRGQQLTKKNYMNDRVHYTRTTDADLISRTFDIFFFTKVHYKVFEIQICKTGDSLIINMSMSCNQREMECEIKKTNHSIIIHHRSEFHENSHTCRSVNFISCDTIVLRMLTFPLRCSSLNMYGICI